MKSEDVFSNSIILKFLFRSSFRISIIKIIAIFFSILLINYVLCLKDNSLIIQNGEKKSSFSFSNGVINKKIPLSDNVISFELQKVDDGNLKGKINLFNKSLDSAVYINQNTNYPIELTRADDSDTLFAHFNQIILARKLDLKIKVIDDLVLVESKISGIGFLQDYANYLFILSFIIAFSLSKLLVNQFLFCFGGIDKGSHEMNFSNGLLKVIKFKNRHEIEEYENKFRKTVEIISIKESKTKKVYYTFYFIIAVFTVFISLNTFINPHELKGNWNFSYDIYKYGFIYNQIKEIILWIIFVPPLLIRIIFIAHYTIKLAHEFDEAEMYQIKSISGDRAGGLAPLGELTLYLFYVVIAFLPPLFATSIILDYPLTHKLIYPLYFIGTFYLFFFPLSAPHKSMKEAKKRELEAIAEKYNTVLDIYKNNKDSRDGKSLLDEMKDIRELYDYSKKMIIWPFDFEILVKFGAVFFTGFFSYLAQFVINLIK